MSLNGLLQSLVLVVGLCVIGRTSVSSLDNILVIVPHEIFFTLSSLDKKCITYHVWFHQDLSSCCRLYYHLFIPQNLSTDIIYQCINTWRIIRYVCIWFTHFSSTATFFILLQRIPHNILLGTNSFLHLCHTLNIVPIGFSYCNWILFLWWGTLFASTSRSYNFDLTHVGPKSVKLESDEFAQTWPNR